MSMKMFKKVVEENRQSKYEVIYFYKMIVFNDF